MCIICSQLGDNKLTPWEASRNRMEMLEVIPSEHLKELDLVIREATLRYILENGDFPPTPRKDVVGTTGSD